MMCEPEPGVWYWERREIVRLQMLEVTRNSGEVSDGYHTFNELYEHRHALFIALCRKLPTWTVWRSQRHADGTMFDGWFIMGAHHGGLQISYHLPIRLWHQTDFAIDLVCAPEWDGHTSSDVIETLYLL
jgi:hypothetical protein